MEPLRRAVDRLTAAGYEDVFEAVADGLRAASTDKVHPPSTFVVEEFERFEGSSDPGDEVIVFALRSRADESKGTYVVAFGPQITPEDETVVQALDWAGGRGRAAR